MEIKIKEIVKDIQNTIVETQEDMEETIYYGKSLDNKVKVAVKGGFNLEEVKIDPSLLNSDSQEKLEKDIIEATNAAIRASQLDYQACFIDLMKEFKIPGF